MENILFSSEAADNINKAVSEKIAHHLVLCCHYHPRAPKACSSDGKFYLGILNLYKFFIDSGIIGKINKVEKISKINTKFYEHKENVCMLRTAISHNKNESNDLMCVEQKYDEWITRQLNKKEITQKEDYDILLNSLEHIGDDTYEIIINYIDYLSKIKNQKEIVHEIEKLWCEFYKNTSGEEIIKNQMWNMYMSESKNSYNNYKWTYIDSNLTNWCEEFYCSSLKGKLDNLEKFLIKVSKLKDREKIDFECDKYRKELNNIREKAEKVGGYLKLYLNEFVDAKIPKEIENIKNDNYRNILPEDMIQEILNRDFEDLKKI